MILFHKVRWKNFLAAGAMFIEIELDAHPTTLVTGKNGYGKSSMLDALTFALFDKPFRKMSSKTELINRPNQADCLVEVEFSIGSNHYLVRRGMKPNIFEVVINGKIEDQDSKSPDQQKSFLENIIKLNYKTFKQIIVLGSSTFIPFMQLPLPERRAFIEDLLGIQIFSDMNKALKKRLDLLKDDLGRIERDQNLADRDILMVESFIEETKRRNAEHVEGTIQRLQSDIDTNQTKLNGMMRDIDVIQKHITDLSAQRADQTTVNNRISKLQNYEEKIRGKIKQAQQHLKLLNDTSCNQCGQHISEEHRLKNTTEQEAALAQYQEGLDKLNTEMVTLSNRLETIMETNRLISDRQRHVSEKMNSVSALQQYIRKMQNEISQVMAAAVVDTTAEEQKLHGLRSQMAVAEAKKQQLIGDKHYYDIASLLLKDDGIKTVVIKQYLPVINKLINHFVTDLDLFASVSLDENFKETIKRRFLDESSYYALSEGQKKRIDIAILFAWREVARSKNSVSTNLLILDEVADSSLDDSGRENFLKLVNEMSANANIFLISPLGGPLQDKFPYTIQFGAEGNYSKIM